MREERQDSSRTDYLDVCVLIRHHLEIQGFSTLSPEPPEPLVDSMCMAGYELEREGVSVHILARQDVHAHTFTLHTATSVEAHVTLPVTCSRRALSRGLTWIHPSADATRALYLVDVLGELFVGTLVRRAHVLLDDPVEVFPEEVLSRLARACQAEDPWLASRIALDSSQLWQTFVSVGQILRHAPLWSNASARAHVYGVLARYREDLDERAVEILKDVWSERCAHLEALIESGARGALLNMLRGHLAAAGALLDWLEASSSGHRLAELDGHVTGERDERRTCDDEPEAWRAWLMDGDAWWVTPRG